MKRELRSYQQEGIDALRASVRNGVKRIVLQLPTGGGKTLISAAIADGVLRKGGRMAFVCPRIALIDQTVDEYWKEGIRGEVGVIQASHQLTDWSAPIQVCSIDTLRSKKAFPEADVVVFDEGHILHEAHKRWMAERPGTVFIALTATPWAKGMGKHFESLLIMETTKGLIDRGYLCPFRVFATGHPDLSGVKIVAGDYHEGQLSDAMQKGTLTADIVDTWIKHWNKDKTLCFAVDCLHAKAIQQRFEGAGISCGYQDAKTPDNERREIKRKFHTGECRVVASVGTLILGVDWDVRCISYCAPTRSEMRYVQAIGRGLRTAEGKTECVILDHSDTTQRLGFVTDIHHDHLDGGTNTKATTKPSAPLPKECPQCTALRPPRVLKCPNCGFEVKPVSGIAEQDGELIDITAGFRKGGKKTPPTPQERQAWYSMLLHIRNERGYKPGWSANQFREKFGFYPRGLAEVATEPTPQVRSWIRSRQIAYAKGRAKHAATA